MKCAFILSLICPISSTARIPPEAITAAPSSKVHLSLKGSFTIAAVSPAELDVFPLVNTPLGEIFIAFLNNWLFAIPGSPISAM
jgi:hypothetical protein